MDQHLEAWKKRSIRIGTPTNLIAAFTAFIPVLWLCSTYNCWPDPAVVLQGWMLVALSFGAFYFVEPVSYYAALGLTGTYLSFLSGNIGNMRVPVAAMALEATNSKPGTLQAEISSTMAICGSIITNLFFTTLAAFVGAMVVTVLPKFLIVGLTKYAAAAIFGATFGNFALKYHKVGAITLITMFVLKKFAGLPAWALIVVSVFGTVAIARFFYDQDKKAGKI